MANEVRSSESKLQSESQEEPLMLFVPLILESAAKPSEDTISEKVKELKQNVKSFYFQSSPHHHMKFLEKVIIRPDDVKL